mmetsp:Transcript_57669/g.135690  ORF Transcript_57669/g.135690 Transcript_57669/m.135690 type:complete len:81 (-) Transcript_57669:137-379(-)
MLMRILASLVFPDPLQPIGDLLLETMEPWFFISGAISGSICKAERPLRHAPIMLVLVQTFHGTGSRKTAEWVYFFIECVN